MTEGLVRLIRAMTPEAWQRLDVVVAVVGFAALTTPALLGYPSHDGSAAAVLLFGAGASLPVAVRRRWPLGVLAVVVACTAVGTAAGVRFTPFVSNAGPGIALAMYTVTQRLDRRISLWALAAAVTVSWVATEIATQAHPHQDHNAVGVVAALVGWLVGDMARSQRAYRDESARRGRAEERLRISREVHDIVSHNLSVIAVQAGVGRLVFDTRPQEARSALVEVEKLSRGALDDLRRLLGAIRTSEALAPTPGLDDLPALVERIRAGGTAVTLDMEGEAADLSPTLQLSVYRIVQEALTNVVKHAAGAAAHVAVRIRPDEVVVEVVNEAGASAAAAMPSGGWGLAGMQERAALFGGRVVAAPDAGGGFRVVAVLPISRVGADR